VGDALLQLEDGTRALAASPDAAIRTVHVEAKRVEVEVLRGAVRFSVTPNGHRHFRVLADEVEVSVLGTVFEVALGIDHVAVAVERGRVRVTGPGDRRVLSTGQSVSVARRASGGAVEEPRGDRGLIPQGEPPSGAAGAEPKQLRSWRTLARAGKYREAYPLLDEVGVQNTPDDLLLAADVARNSGDPQRAVTYLRKVTSAHRFLLFSRFRL
jgi:hypothetical protein